MRAWQGEAGKKRKATVLIEVYPCTGLAAISKTEVAPDVRNAGNYPFALKPEHGGSQIQNQNICLAFDILPQDFFLGDAERLEAFLDNPMVSERVYFFGPKLENAPKQDNASGNDGYFCVRVRLLPMPKCEDTESGCKIVGRGIQKIADFVRKI